MIEDIYLRLVSFMLAEPDPRLLKIMIHDLETFNQPLTDDFLAIRYEEIESWFS